MSERFLVLKRDLYYRPNDCGYTGIKDNAARYSRAEAEDRCRLSYGAVTMMAEEGAPEFTGACFDDLARDHLRKQRDDARDALAASQAEVARLRIVTDEMVERGAAAAIDHVMADDWWPPDEIDAANMVRAILAAALAASQPQGGE
jgi:hypothetical protein